MTVTVKFKYTCDFCGDAQESTEMPIPSTAYPLPLPYPTYKPVGHHNACNHCYDLMIAHSPKFRGIPK